METIFSRLQKTYLLWVNQWSKATDENDRLPAFLVRIGSLIALYVCIDRVLARLTYLTPQEFHNPVIFFAFLKHLFASKYLLILIFASGFLVYFRKRLLPSWDDFPNGRSIRLPIVAAAGSLAWFFSTYSYNLYLDQGHYFDRLLLILFLLLIYWRPVFTLPFLVILMPIIWQFTLLEGFTWSHPFLPIRILILFSSYFLIYLVVQKYYIDDLVFLLCCLIAAHYWTSGFGKLSLDWIQFDHIYLLLPSTYANGWLNFINSETISWITETLSWFNIPMKVFTLIVEFGCLFFFWHRNAARFFLSGWIMLHLGIFFVSGIFFWMWIAIEIPLLWAFTRKENFVQLPIFGKRQIVVSMFLIVTGAYWCKPPRLAWFDVPVSYTYRYLANTADGKIVTLPPKFFEPYEYQFTLGTFLYINDNPTLPITWGSTPGPGVARSLMEINSEEAFFKYENANGNMYGDEKRAGKLDAFLKRYVGNWNNRHSNDTNFNYLKAPRLLWTYPVYVDLGESDTINTIRIERVTSFYLNGKYREIRVIPVRDIPIKTRPTN